MNSICRSLSDSHFAIHSPPSTLRHYVCIFAIYAIFFFFSFSPLKGNENKLTQWIVVVAVIDGVMTKISNTKSASLTSFVDVHVVVEFGVHTRVGITDGE